MRFWMPRRLHVHNATPFVEAPGSDHRVPFLSRFQAFQTPYGTLDLRRKVLRSQVLPRRQDLCVHTEK
jgi:hypothetical protein